MKPTLYKWEAETELKLDVDDLRGIVMQLEAICNGWGMDFEPVEEEECFISYINWTIPYD